MNKTVYGFEWSKKKKKINQPNKQTNIKNFYLRVDKHSQQLDVEVERLFHPMVKASEDSQHALEVSLDQL